MSLLSTPDQQAPTRSWIQQAKARLWRLGPISIIPFAVILLLFVLIALMPGWFAKHDPTLTALSIRLKSPGFVGPDGSSYLLGTDELGRDVFSRLIYGARVSLFVSVTAVFISGIIGGLLGMLAGFYRNWVGALIMRVADILLSIPFFLLAILTVAVLGPSLLNLIIVLGLARWPRYARVTQSTTLSTVNKDFVKATAALGARPGRLLIRHILPEVIPPLVVVATLEVGLMIIFEASLSFIGLGVQPPNPSWGSMLSVGQQYVSTAWWLATFPGIAIFLIVISINMIGDYVRDRLDPKNQKR
ncbi:ABC transporter permease [Paenibacillus radicis (ex Xue et al. 2023)]|uniref:ABC transporter permease n=1 Tax=Paenibacillus radicis (ex Xue et al. 2023) TaxID=2972489 RepID=A0ABT1YPX8_9BACL|nr:ABC transporter permease [Paenibacillus radicis (ex Xue et al. 2023)]MCR8635230.1 ABC transporter permease [Paenibacillus radicis (ex Xue et al. 2023)]